jgi:hypothetical protein
MTGSGIQPKWLIRHSSSRSVRSSSSLAVVPAPVRERLLAASKRPNRDQVVLLGELNRRTVGWLARAHSPWFAAYDATPVGRRVPTGLPETPAARAPAHPSGRSVAGECLLGCQLGVRIRSVRGRWNTCDMSLSAFGFPRHVARGVQRRVPVKRPRAGCRRPGPDTEEDASMRFHRNQTSPSSPPDAVAVVGLIRTHWVLAVCVVCGHERPHGERHRASCPTCGAQLRSFALYRDLEAGQ